MPGKKRQLNNADRRSIFDYMVRNTSRARKGKGYRSRRFVIPGKVMEGYTGKDKKRHFIDYAKNIYITPRSANRWLTVHGKNYPARFKPQSYYYK